MRLPGDWVEKAGFLLRDAERHLEEGVFWFACFEAQQAVELYLKALHLALTGFHPYTHDLVELLDSLKVLGLKPPEELYTYADALTLHYTMVLYPGGKQVTYSRGLAERCIRYARGIINWVGRKLPKLIAERVRRMDMLLDEYVKILSEKYPKCTIILFGSRARGDYMPYSDYDIAIIVEDYEDLFETIVRFRRLKPLGLPLDLIVLKVEDLDDPLTLRMFRECKILYDGLKIGERIRLLVMKHFKEEKS